LRRKRALPALSGMGVSMGHYFSRETDAASAPKTYPYEYNGETFVFATDTGVFSYGKMDAGTDILLRNIPPLTGSLLDLACGNCCIGIVLGRVYGLTVTQTDTNARAAALAAKNAAANGIKTTVQLSDGFENIEGVFDTITLNPPIHAGKDTVFALYEGAFRHLRPGGRLYIVILKKHGAESTRAFLMALFGNCEVVYKKKGCYIFALQKFDK